MSACFLCCISSHCKKVYFLTVYCCQKDNTFTKFAFQLVAKVTKSVHIHSVYFCSKKFHTFDFYYFIHNISQSSLSQFAL